VYDQLQAKLAELNGGLDGSLIKEALCDAGDASQYPFHDEKRKRRKRYVMLEMLLSVEQNKIRYNGGTSMVMWNLRVCDDSLDSNEVGFPVTNTSFDALLESLLSTAKPFTQSAGYRILAS
nr:hypothetical protein [Tanacetum cinerariifolium]